MCGRGCVCACACVLPGYTVTSVVSARNGRLIVAGAPRFNHTGKVIIFTLKNSGELTILHSLKGQQVCSARLLTWHMFRTALTSLWGGGRSLWSVRAACVSSWCDEAWCHWQLGLDLQWYWTCEFWDPKFIITWTQIRVSSQFLLFTLFYLPIFFHRFKLNYWFEWTF